MTSNNLLSRGMIAVLAAQFLSALADNALLFAAIAELKAHAAPSWQTPMLQEAFVVAFIFLAPFVGPFADAWPKGRVMLVANAMKFVGAAAMLLGLHPLIAYNLVGIGAAAYSPAKYGILSELVGKDKLVKANGLMEGSTIVAILLGAVVGGKLADISVVTALVSICGCYLLAAGANTLIPRLPVAHALPHISPIALIRDFFSALTTLIRNPDARFSMLGTSIFWGAGSTLRLLLVAWVPVALGIADLSMPANMSGGVAVGIALGAAAAASFVGLDKVNRVLPAGILIGLIIIVFAHLTHLYPAIALLLLVGACGGFYVVPLNALLQERGHESVGAGHAVAVQNFVENIAMLGLVGLYTLMDKSGMPVVQSATVFGAVVTLTIGLLAMLRLMKK
ncbi:MFS transporter, LPLT family, lysophospholipid transporter [Novimethylophilus kurashikiensis]|uniref:MFS transporter, LPLT family, lysophospholipid transporter n=1 Tax=Novimethylophilus kurashikiensis TaxID=1825523 RepID=A0A2R5F149_9PROT|nr:lysophospholipid transporter LplT [Novimethylophilus kurashikiensis]GBG12482.1 MFS transporter, LPLT family, lysophospholipid transporter [Novimethylophilus kurashikiensis]